MNRIFLLILLLDLFFLSSQAQTIRVLTYNTHHCEDMNGKLNIEHIASVIKKANPDIVALQELDSMTNRTHKVDQLKALAEATHMNYFFSKSMDYDGGGYGVGILTKFPIVNAFITRLPNVSDREPRTAGTVELQLGKKKRFLFTSVHLDYVKDSTERIAQASKLKEVFSSKELPSIIAGDFNAPPTETTIKDIMYSVYNDSDPTGNTLSHPSDEPKRKIDYILISKNHSWKKKHYEVIADKIGSDHRPVLSVIKW